MLRCHLATHYTRLVQLNLVAIHIKVWFLSLPSWPAFTRQLIISSLDKVDSLSILMNPRSLGTQSVCCALSNILLFITLKPHPSSSQSILTPSTTHNEPPRPYKLHFSCKLTSSECFSSILMAFLTVQWKFSDVLNFSIHMEVVPL